VAGHQEDGERMGAVTLRDLDSLKHQYAASVSERLARWAHHRGASRTNEKIRWNSMRAVAGKSEGIDPCRQDGASQQAVQVLEKEIDG